MGALLYKALQADGVQVRGLVRNVTKAREILGCTACNASDGIFVGDITEPASLAAVMKGADTLAIATASTPVCSGGIFPFKKCTFHKGAEPKNIDWLGTKAQLEAFAETGDVKAKQVLYVSTMETTKPDNFLDKLGKGYASFYHLLSEAYIMSSGVPFTIVKACGLGDGEPGKHRLLVGHDDASFSLALNHEVHREDVARVLAEAIRHREVGLRFDFCSAALGEPTTDIEKDVLQAARYPWDQPKQANMDQVHIPEFYVVLYSGTRDRFPAEPELEPELSVSLAHGVGPV
ncbi:unnamed protein product [Effrenium voratum]|nr:unnamed protein product [Effrenium voratum]